MGGGRRERTTEASGGERNAGGDGGGGQGAGSDNSSSRPPVPPVAVGRVPLHRLFSFADRTDALLMAVGALAAVANGMAQPLMTFIFGDVIDAFGSAASSSSVLHRVVKVKPLFFPGCTSFVSLLLNFS